MDTKTSLKKVKDTHKWVSKFIRRIETAHKNAAKSKLVFRHDILSAILRAR